MKKRLFHNMALLLCICLLVAMMPTEVHAKTGLEGWQNIDFYDWHNMSKRAANITVKNGEYEYFTGSSTSGFLSPAYHIFVKGKDTVANLFFYNCTIDMSDDNMASASYGSPIEILEGASANIYIAGTCTFKGFSYGGTAAIHKNQAEGQLNIYVAEGATLNLTGGFDAAAIGGNPIGKNPLGGNAYTFSDGYNIAIGGPGTVNVTCGSNAPAIGSSREGKADNIVIGRVDTPEFPASDNASGIYHFEHAGGATSHFWGTRWGVYEDYKNVGLADCKNQHMIVWLRGSSEMSFMTDDAVLASKAVADGPIHEAKITYENCTKKWGNRELVCTVCGKKYDTDTTAPVVGLNDGDKYTLINDEPLKFSVTDDKSGVAKVSYYAEKEKPVILTAGTDGKYSLPIKRGTRYTVIVMDNAGNIDWLSFHVRYVYTVNFIADGKIIHSTELREDEALTTNDIPAIPKKDGYTDTDPHWDVDVLDADDIIAKASGSIVNVNAIYTANTHTVTYDENGHGTAPSAVTAYFGSKIAAPTAPTAKGYLFGGWYKDSPCTDDWDFGVDTIAGETTLYAKWIQCDHSGNTTLPSHTDKTICSVCNGDVDPIGHAFDKEVVDTQYLKSLAGCTHGATYYKSCSCGASSEGQTGEAIFTVGSALGHLYSADWEFDKDNHWHKCSRCGEKKDITAHKWDASAETERQDRQCAVCGYVAKTGAQTGDDSNMLLWLAIMLLSCSAMATTAYIKRKKTA